MPYVVALLPMLAFVGVVGALVSLARGRPRAAAIFGLVGAAAIASAIALFYSAT